MDKSKLQRFLQDYQQYYYVAEEQKVRLTYQPVFILARKKRRKMTGKIIFVSGIDTDVGKNSGNWDVC